MKRNLFLSPAGGEGGGGADVATQLVESQRQLTAMTGERDTARTALTAMTGERDTARTALTAMTGERDMARTELATARTSITALTGERDTARTALTAAEGTVGRLTGDVNRLTESQNDFDGKVRAKLTGFGIRMEAVTLPSGETKMEVKNKDGSENWTAALMTEIASRKAAAK